MDGRDSGAYIVAEAGACATCKEPAYIVRKTGERVCARCYADDRRRAGADVKGDARAAE